MFRNKFELVDIRFLLQEKLTRLFAQFFPTLNYRAKLRIREVLSGRTNYFPLGDSIRFSCLVLRHRNGRRIYEQLNVMYLVYLSNSLDLQLGENIMSYLLFTL